MFFFSQKLHNKQVQRKPNLGVISEQNQEERKRRKENERQAGARKQVKEGGCSSEISKGSPDGESPPFPASESSGNTEKLRGKTERERDKNPKHV